MQYILTILSVHLKKLITNLKKIIKENILVWHQIKQLYNVNPDTMVC